MKFNQLTTAALEKKGEASKFRSSYNLAYCYFKQKNYTNAEIYFGYAADEANKTVDEKGKQALLPDLYMRWGDCAFVTKNYAKALAAYTYVVDNNWSGGDYAQLQKGIIYGLQNRDEEKVAAMNQLISKFPGSNYVDRAYFEIGETQLENNNLSAARAAYQNVITKFPNSSFLPKCYLKTAVIDYNSNKKEQALEDYKEVVRKFPKTPEEKEALDALREIYVELGRADEYFAFVKNNTNLNISTAVQDSLTYQSADNAYSATDCAKAITLFGNYINKFPNGFFINEAHWKKAECHIKVKDFVPALIDLEALIENKYGKYYEKALLKASGIAFYEVKDYNKALNLYRMLYVASTSQANTYTAITGMFRAAVQVKNNESIIEYADQLINSGLAKEGDIQEAYFEKGKAWYAMGNKELAKGAFNRVAEHPVNERCVEAKYMVAKILFEQQNYKASQDTCFKLKNRYASYEYWVVKTFLLIADNYAALGNAFQAKATLESIVNNYEGDQALLNEAKEKLEKIRTEELNKTKIMPMQVLPQDTLIMESDSLINNNK
jgi:TolA-binding protein